MVKQQSRVWIGVYVIADLLTTFAAFALAYFIRFHSDLLSVTKGVNPFTQYLYLLPLILFFWPTLFYLHGLYSLKRLRSRTDELFSIVWAVAMGTAALAFVAPFSAG